MKSWYVFQNEISMMEREINSWWPCLSKRLEMICRSPFLPQLFCDTPWYPATFISKPFFWKINESEFKATNTSSSLLKQRRNVNPSSLYSIKEKNLNSEKKSERCMGDKTTCNCKGETSKRKPSDSAHGSNWAISCEWFLKLHIIFYLALVVDFKSNYSTWLQIIKQSSILLLPKSSLQRFYFAEERALVSSLDWNIYFI